MQKETDLEREKHIEDLQNAITMLKARSGLLPRCTACKRIKDHEGHWKQIKSNVKDDSEAEFTHGICPDCAKKIYPEFYDENKYIGNQESRDQDAEHGIFASPLPYPVE